MAFAPHPLGVATGAGRVPPHSIEAEQSVLGGVLFDNEGLGKALDFLKTGEEFYKPAHKLIYGVFIELYEKNEPVDIITVSEHLRKKKLLDDVGGTDYLAKLAELTPTASNVGTHAKIVKEKALLRKLVVTAGEVMNLGYEDSDDVDDIIDRAEKLIFDLAQDRLKENAKDIKTIVKETIKDIERLFERKELITGLPTGWSKFDEMTAGFQPGDLIIMAGRPSMGKTAICINIMEYLAVRHNKAVAFFSLEMSAMQLVLRIISSLSRISMHKIRTGYLAHSDWPKITQAVGELYETAITIDDGAMQTVLDIRAKARRLKADNKLDMIVIDYLQLMTGRGHPESRVLEISEITRGLKAMARELKVPVIAISQLSRKVEERTNKRPQLSDLRESGSIEQDADLVAFVYREEYYSPDKLEVQGLAEVIIAKQRNGPVGAVKLAFNKECTRFDAASYDSPSFETDMGE
ncbi:MAG: replicative DNA helicase [Nitrospinae bacterium]|nr:replicative DNA helicase [Nitrospinota bacterium]